MAADHAGRSVVDVLRSRPCRRVAAFTISVAAVAVACQPDRLTTTTASPDAALQIRTPANQRPPGGPPDPTGRVITKEAALTNRMPSRDSVNQCFVTQIDRSTAMPRTTHRTVVLRDASASERSVAGEGRVAASRDTSATALFYYIRVDANGKTTQRVNCAIPNTEAAYAAAANTFSLDGYKGRKPDRPLQKSAGSVRGESEQGSRIDEAFATPEVPIDDASAEPLEVYPSSESASGHVEGEADFSSLTSEAVPTRGWEYDCYFDLETEWVSCGEYNCRLQENGTYDCGEGCFINPTGQSTSDDYWYYDFIWETWVVVSWEIVGYQLDCPIHSCDEQTLVPSEWDEECEEQDPDPQAPSAPLVQLKCGGVDVDVVVERKQTINCVLMTTDSTVDTLYGSPWRYLYTLFDPNVYALTYVDTTGRMLWSGDLVKTGTIGAQVKWRRTNGDSGITLTTSIAKVTVTPRTGFPSVALSDVLENWDMPTVDYGEPPGGDTLGYTQALGMTVNPQWETIQQGPNRGYAVLQNMPYKVEVIIGYQWSLLDTLISYADSIPTDGSCSKEEVESLQQLTTEHEGEQYESGSHAAAIWDYLDANRTSIRERAEAAVTKGSANNTHFRHLVLNTTAMDAANAAVDATGHGPAAMMSATHGCTLRTSRDPELR